MDLRFLSTKFELTAIGSALDWHHIQLDSATNPSAAWGQTTAHRPTTGLLTHNIGIYLNLYKGQEGQTIQSAQDFF